MTVMLELPPQNPRLVELVDQIVEKLGNKGFTFVIVKRRGDPDLGVITTITIQEQLSV